MASEVAATGLPEPIPGFKFNITGHPLHSDWHDATSGQKFPVHDYQYDRPGDIELRAEDIQKRTIRKWLEVSPDLVPIIRYKYTEDFPYGTLRQGPTFMLDYWLDKEWLDTHLDNFKTVRTWDKCQSEFAGRSHGRIKDSKIVAFGRRKSCIQLFQFVPVDVICNGKYT